MNIRKWLGGVLAVALLSGACLSLSGAEEEEMSASNLAALSERFSSLSLASTLKPLGADAPVMTQRFGADPYALVYEERVYLYMTGDTLEYDVTGKVVNNTYSRINTLNVVSSADLMNWTDHGCVAAAGPRGAAKWGNQSWAPAVACKEIDGQMKFFIYFANGGNGIGVLTADSPTGPFVDPLGKALVSRATPNCANVTWLFDPAVMVDEDGSAYLYFGGGIPQGQEAAPGTGRVVKLGADMISLDGAPQALDIPYLFEDSGINRIGDTYYYSYCTNWNVSPEAKRSLGIDNAQIAYMTSDNPMGPFAFGGVILKNPGVYYGCYGNNHHCIFSFHDQWYIAYHTQMLEKPLNISGGYRSTSVSRITLQPDGSIPTLQHIDRFSLDPVGHLNPFVLTSAATMNTMGGLNTRPKTEGERCGDMLVCDIDSGDWLALSGVDFAEGARAFRLHVVLAKNARGAVQLRLDSVTGPVIGYVPIDGAGEITVPLLKKVEGVHNLVMIFDGEGYSLDSWQFLA